MGSAKDVLGVLGRQTVGHDFWLRTKFELVLYFGVCVIRSAAQRQGYWLLTSARSLPTFKAVLLVETGGDCMQMLLEFTSAYNSKSAGCEQAEATRWCRAACSL